MPAGVIADIFALTVRDAIAGAVAIGAVTAADRDDVGVATGLPGPVAVDRRDPATSRGAEADGVFLVAAGRFDFRAGVNRD
jgi:hypothetical protein